MTRSLAFALLLLLSACGGDEPAAPSTTKTAPTLETIDFGETPQAMTLDGAPATIVPPPGSWQHGTDNPAEDQWMAEWRDADDTVLLRAFTFPTQGTTDPVPVLMQAVDTFLRSLGVDGFGLPTRKARSLWGAPAADATLAAARGGVRIEGDARLLLAAPDRWALAVAFGPADAPVTAKDQLHRFVRSLEPSAPRFYERIFRNELRLDEAAFQPKGEEPVTHRDIAAVLVLLQAGADARVPLATEATLNQALIDQARALKPEARQGYRDAAPAFPTWVDMPAEERAQGMRSLGARMLKGIFERANTGDMKAMQFANAWQYLGKIAVGTQADGLNVGQLTNLVEMSAFLASVAANRDVARADGLGTDVRDTLTKGLEERWATLSDEDKAALRRSGSQWARLRRAWDLATPEDRAAFRRAVVAELAEAEHQEHIARLDPGRALMAWIEEHAAPGQGATFVRRAFALSPAARAELIGLLAVEDRPFALGW